MLYFDFTFTMATLAFGLGLSLATYRWVAQHNGWPMGELHADVPIVPVVIGIFSILAAVAFAAARGAEYGGWGVLVLGLLLAFVWTGILRVGSQVSLFAAPVAAALLLIKWIA